MPRQLEPAPLEADGAPANQVTREPSSRYYIDHHQDMSRNPAMTSHTTLDLLQKEWDVQKRNKDARRHKQVLKPVVKANQESPKR